MTNGNPPTDEQIKHLISEQIEIVPYNSNWIEMFKIESDFLRRLFTSDLIPRIEHFGSTAVPGLAAKPIVDMLVEVRNLAEAIKVMLPILTFEGYEYCWRPPFGDDAPPEDWYAWFIKRNSEGHRTHHLHVVEASSKLWDRLLFRDYLISHPSKASAYERLKREIATSNPIDRVAYTRGKDEFINEIMMEILSTHEVTNSDLISKAK